MSDIFDQSEMLVEDVFGAPPVSVMDNVRELDAIKSQRRQGNAAVARKNDTERYLVIVYKSREDREAALAEMGLPSDERYLAGSAVRLGFRDEASAKDAIIIVGRSVKAAPEHKSGAAG